jgi:hypothetical protein
MSDIVFAKTRHQYDSYADFWRLVELSEFPVIYTDEIETGRDYTVIYTPNNGDTANGWPDARARIVLFQLEWETHPNDSGPLPPGVSEKWTHDKWHAERLNCRYVPIGSHPGLVHGPLEDDAPITYDVALLAYMTNRRKQMAYDLNMRGLRLAPNAWGSERHTILQRSSVMLHIHQHDDVPGVAALRLAVAAAYSLPVITEHCADLGIFGYSHLLMSDYANLADFTHLWTRRNEAHILADYGRSLYQLLCVEKTFRRCIEGEV